MVTKEILVRNKIDLVNSFIRKLLVQDIIWSQRIELSFNPSLLQSQLQTLSNLINHLFLLKNKLHLEFMIYPPSAWSTLWKRRNNIYSVWKILILRFLVLEVVLLVVFDLSKVFDLNYLFIFINNKRCNLNYETEQR